MFWDSVFLIDIILVFFTAAELDKRIDTSGTEIKQQRNPKNKSVFMRYEYNMKRIAKRYLLTYFIFDILTCLPTLLTYNNIPSLYYFKILRFLQLPRVYAWFGLVKKVILNDNLKAEQVRP